jgi:hypothetical protein
MSKERQICFSDVMMFMLSRAILLICVWTGNMVGDVELGEEGAKLMLFASPICLNGKNLVIKSSLDKSPKFLKFLKYLRFKF